MTSSFGPTALATPANAVTMARVAGTPVLLVWILGSGASWPAALAWTVLASSDGLDGWIARRHGATRSGAFLDPLADKFLVLGAMWALVARGRFWWVPVAAITLREVAMSVYRVLVGRRGVSIPARRSAKLKTLVQALAVGIALVPPVDETVPGLATVLLWVAAALTVTSGVQYWIDGRKAADAV